MVTALSMFASVSGRLIPQRVMTTGARGFAAGLGASAARSSNRASNDGSRVPEIDTHSFNSLADLENGLKTGAIANSSDFAAAIRSVTHIRANSRYSDEPVKIPIRDLSFVAVSILEKPQLTRDDFVSLITSCFHFIRRGNKAFWFRPVAEKAFEIVESKKVPIDVETFISIIAIMSATEMKNLKLKTFVDDNMKKICGQLTNSTARKLLRVLDQSMCEKDSIQLAVEALEKDIDDMRNRDVVSNLIFLSRGNFNRAVFTKCCELLENHTALFESRELILCWKALDSLGLTNRVIQNIKFELRKKCRTMRPPFISMYLRLLSRCTPREQVAADDVITQLLTAPDLYSKLAMCEAIVSLKLDARRDVLSGLMSELVHNDEVIRKDAGLLIELITSCEVLYGMKFDIPQDLETKLSLYQSRDSRVVSSIKYMDSGSDYKFEFPDGPLVGRFKPVLVDANKRIVIEADVPELCRGTRSHVYSEAGYACCFMKARDVNYFKKEGTEKLVRRLDGALVRQGLMEREAFEAKYMISEQLQDRSQKSA